MWKVLVLKGRRERRFKVKERKCICVILEDANL